MKQMMPAVEKPVKETCCWKMRNDGSDRETTWNHRVCCSPALLCILLSPNVSGECLIASLIRSTAERQALLIQQ
ncbi:hypothetical protein VZT92_007615 [Zoarces viviparus]|uniref:Uncharacterized protein n=1 Tax=Zoarces viviparus TaxID=48416 RepID=A0AAW1FK57_ZOAVI